MYRTCRTRVQKLLDTRTSRVRLRPTGSDSGTGTRIGLERLIAVRLRCGICHECSTAVRMTTPKDEEGLGIDPARGN